MPRTKVVTNAIEILAPAGRLPKSYARNANNPGAFKPGNKYAMKPGETKNPKGRPKGTGLKKISEAYFAVLQQPLPVEVLERLNLGLPKGTTGAEAIARGMSLKAACGDAPAAKELREVTEGKLPESHRMIGPDGETITPPSLVINFVE